MRTKSVTATARARLEKSHTTEMVLFEEGTSFPASFSPTTKAEAGLAASPAGAKGRRVCSRCRCKAAARRARGNPGPEAGNPQKRKTQRLLVHSHPHSAKGYSEDGNRGCRQGGALSQGQTSLTKVVGLEVAPQPQRNPHEVSLFCSPAKVPELTLPIAGERQMEKHHRNREIFSCVGFGWSRGEKPKIFVRTMLFVISFCLFIQMMIQSPHWKDSC